jgi:DNA-binding response OmpR family regulator
MDGFEVCQRLKQNPATAKIPVIFMTELDDAQDKMRAVAEGATDYVVKPFQGEDLLHRISGCLTISRQRNKDQSPSL